ncbi:3'-5' exonuclease [Salegentibacter maritimus]|uniref:3'-5' exonuclease n=1 Tax=Salegentibacter maritimus TaxID=2794347 RepID=UPI0018E41D02|nr:3'-5' exonuclease [Salegentibacter maritimus]MBI6116727.1 3'-5' exonuclease [Salegentibacter maritimus]
MTLISSKTEFVTDFNEEDITKHLLDDVYLFVDIETSGLPEKTNSGTKYPEILQVAWVLTNKKGIILKKNSFIIDTPFLTNNDSSEFVNIDFKTARKVKFPISQALKKLVEDIKMCNYVVAHNIEFDLEILGHYYTNYYGTNPFNGKNKICTMKSTINFCAIPNNYGYKYPKLSELYFKLFSYKVKNSHNAEVDVLHTLKCFKKLQNIGVL